MAVVAFEARCRGEVAQADVHQGPGVVALVVELHP